MVQPALSPPTSAYRRISLRWRLLWPLAIVVLLVVTIGAYLLSNHLTTSYDERETDDLVATSHDIATDALSIGDHHHREIFRLANTGGVRENIASRNSVTLHQLVEPNAMLAELDLVIVVAKDGQEILGLQRVQDGDTVDYTVTSQTDLTSVSGLTGILNGETPSASTLIYTPQGTTLVTLEPVYSPAAQIMGAIVVGTRLEHVLGQLQANTTLELAIFAADGDLVQTTFSTGEAIALPRDTVANITNTQTVTDVTRLAETRYQVAYTPFVIDSQPVGILAVYRQSTALFPTKMGAQMFSLLTTLFAACVVIVGYVVIARMVQRLEHVRDTAQALADGQADARTQLTPTDEIGELAAALDRYADSVQHRTDHLVNSLQRQRRESARLTVVIESVPDGLVITDLNGRVLMMNSTARELIGGVGSWRRGNFQQLTAATTDALGPALAPGIYSVGSASRIMHQNKVLQTQTAAVVTPAGKRLGMLVTLREVSSDVRREQRYEALLDELAHNVQLPIAHMAQDAALTAINIREQAASDSLLRFARDIARNARAMQRIITDLRDLNTFDPQDVERGQKPILVSDLLWQLAAQWKPTANAADLVLNVKMPVQPCYVLGDERRLRWAIGNTIDNAIKYSLPNRAVLLIGAETPDGTMAHIQIIDRGVGILPDDIPHIFDRFYRGKPTRPDGTVIQQPGTGQGLHLARRVVQAHGGDVVVESSIGAGTTVHFWLPLTAEVTLEMPEDVTQPLQIQAEAVPVHHQNEDPTGYQQGLH